MRLVPVVAALLAGLAPLASAQPISYQGRFADAGQSPAGTYDIRFTVYDAATGGNALGPVLTRTLTLASGDDGVFSVDDLDFGSSVFFGPARWMELAISKNGDPFVVLSPRQRINHTPYALHAVRSGTTLQQAYANGRLIENSATLPVRITGTLESGSPSHNGVFSLFQPGASAPVLQMTNAAGQGGSLRLFNELGAEIAHMEADPEGQGARFSLAGDGGSLQFDADLSASGLDSGSRFSVTGPAASFVLDTSLTGNAALVLPPASVGPEELFSGVGLASVFRNTGAGLGSTISTITSRSITVPGPGYVVAIATCNIGFQRASNADGVLIIAVSDVANTLPGTARTLVRMPRSSLTFGQYDFPGVSHAVFEVDEAGLHTFYFNGNASGMGIPTISNANLSLIFVPTTYGQVMPTLLDSGSGTDYLPEAPMSREEMLAEQVAEQRRALAELREQQERFRIEMQELREKLHKQ